MDCNEIIEILKGFRFECLEMNIILKVCPVECNNICIWIWSNWNKWKNYGATYWYDRCQSSCVFAKNCVSLFDGFAHGLSFFFLLKIKVTYMWYYYHPLKLVPSINQIRWVNWHSLSCCLYFGKHNKLQFH